MTTAQKPETVAALATDHAQGVKHLIECSCVLPQLKYQNPLTYHRFVVFSVIEPDGSVRPKHVQCNNCGMVHRVVELGRSEMLAGRDEFPTVVTLDDVRASIPEKIARLLESYKAPLPLWEECQFVLENELWGSRVILQTDKLDGRVMGKTLLISGPTKARVETFDCQEVFEA